MTRIECPDSGVVITGRFSLGWIGRLTPEQLDFVGLLLRSRNNLQKLASDLGIAYNTARTRLDEVVAAVGAPPDPRAGSRSQVLDRLAAGEIDVDEAARLLRE